MIHRASVSDIPAIREMAEVVFRQTYHDILSPEQMEYMMDMMYSSANIERQMTRARSGDFPIGNGFFLNDYIMSLDM